MNPDYNPPAGTPAPSVMSGTPAVPPTKNHKKLYIIVGILVLVIGLAIGGYFVYKHYHHKKVVVVSTTKTTSTSSQTVEGLQLNTNKNYGNKYSDGILPVGDGKYVTSSPKVGYVYTCSQYAQSLTASNGGAQQRGPWFTDNNTEYDVSQKVQVGGNVMWQAQFTNTLSGNTRTIVTNDLPNHATGIFPIMSSDAAYQYDQNPNSIKGQNFTYTLNANPQYGSPQCMGGESGIMLTGVALFNAFDAGGRDAGAWEVQDKCDGHPQMDGIYHYHTLSSCIKDVSVQTVIGYALDGFPITGPEIAPNDVLTTSDLDVCHGITSQINYSGKLVTMYHYVMTEDFPYSISCFRSTPIKAPDLTTNQPPA